MERNFAAVMSELRHARGLSQRKVAADLKISQALLSHYENGAREPGLAFVCRACDYYGVSAAVRRARPARPNSSRHCARSCRTCAQPLTAPRPHWRRFPYDPTRKHPQFFDHRAH